MSVYIHWCTVYRVEGSKGSAMITNPAEDAPGGGAAALGAARSRDADNTRLLLLQAARIRFARDGYAATTVRDIATDAGVNVALINRYFVSKEGLFEACLARVAEDLGPRDDAKLTLDQILQAMVHQVVGLPSGDNALQLMLLLRSSGDDQADRIRRRTLDSYAEGIAAAAGWRRGEPDDDQLLLRAQIALSVGLGIVLLRSSAGIEPLVSASEDELGKPLGDLLSRLLAP